jgi:hypothetical protein
MALRDRLVRILGSNATVAGGVALLILVLVLLWPVLGPLARDGGTVAWIVGMGVVVFALGHLTIRVHVRRKENAARDAHGELSFRMESETGPHVSTHGEHLTRYGGRSHSGERPRFD